MNEQEIRDTLSQWNDISLPNKDAVLEKCRTAAAPQAPKRPRKRYSLPRRSAIVAACVCALVLLPMLSLEVAAAEREEYEQAVEFFDEYGLSTDGYSRGEIKKICKDITSERFTYHLTRKALEDSLGITQVSSLSLSPDEVRVLWERQQAAAALITTDMQSGLQVMGSICEQGISFVHKVQVRYANTMDEAYTVLEKYRDGRQEWVKTFPGLSVIEVQHNEQHIVLIGVSGKTESNRMLLLLTAEGDLIWEKPIEDASALLLESDRITVIGNGWRGGIDQSKLYIASFDMQGNSLQTVSRSFYDLNFGHIQFADQSYQQPGYTVEKAIRVGESYYLVLVCHVRSASRLVKSQMSVARISTDGYLEAMYEINEPMTSHRITDIAVKGNTLYIGGYYLPSTSGPLDNGLLLNPTEELDPLKATLLADEDRPDEATFLALLRAQYTGFVISCDTRTGEIDQLKTAAGAKEAAFKRSEDGELVWNYQFIADAQYTITGGDPTSWDPSRYVEIDIVYHDASYIFD